MFCIKYYVDQKHDTFYFKIMNQRITLDMKNCKELKKFQYYQLCLTSYLDDISWQNGSGKDYDYY